MKLCAPKARILNIKYGEYSLVQLFRVSLGSHYCVEVYVADLSC